MDPVVLRSFFPSFENFAFFPQNSAVKKIVSHDRILANLHIMFSVFCLLVISEHFTKDYSGPRFLLEKNSQLDKNSERFSNSMRFFFSRSDKMSEIFFVKARFCIRIVCISINIAYFLMYSK